MKHEEQLAMVDKHLTSRLEALKEFTLREVKIIGRRFALLESAVIALESKPSQETINPADVDAKLSEPIAEPVAYTGSGSLSAIKSHVEGWIWGSKAEAHPIPLYLSPQQPDSKAEDQIYAALDAEILKRQGIEDELDQAYERLERVFASNIWLDKDEFYEMNQWFNKNGKAIRGVR